MVSKSSCLSISVGVGKIPKSGVGDKVYVTPDITQFSGVRFLISKIYIIRHLSLLSYSYQIFNL